MMRERGKERERACTRLTAPHLCKLGLLQKAEDLQGVDVAEPEVQSGPQAPVKSLASSLLTSPPLLSSSLETSGLSNYPENQKDVLAQDTRAWGVSQEGYQYPLPQGSGL